MRKLLLNSWVVMKTDKTFLFVFLCLWITGSQLYANDLESKYRVFLKSSFGLSERVLDIEKILESNELETERKNLDRKIDQLNREILHSSRQKLAKYSAGKTELWHYDPDMNLATFKLIWHEEIKHIFPETKKVNSAYIFTTEKEARQWQSKDNIYFYFALTRRDKRLYISNIYLNKAQQFFLRTYQKPKKVKRNRIYMQDAELNRLRQAIESVDRD